MELLRIMRYVQLFLFKYYFIKCDSLKPFFQKDFFCIKMTKYMFSHQRQQITDSPTDNFISFSMYQILWTDTMINNQRSPEFCQFTGVLYCKCLQTDGRYP